MWDRGACVQGERCVRPLGAISTPVAAGSHGRESVDSELIEGPVSIPFNGHRNLHCQSGRLLVLRAGLVWGERGRFHPFTPDVSIRRRVPPGGQLSR